LSERAPTPASLTRLAAERIDDGDLDDARAILAEALGLDPHYEPAWLWFAHIARNAGERRFALEQAIAANPESVARQELAKLRNVTAIEPPEVVEIVPPPSPLFATERPVAARIVWRANRKVVATTLALIVLATVAAVFVFLTANRIAPLYIAVVDTPAAADSGAGEVVNSARLFFDRINANGGINGHPVELLVYNDQNDPALAKEVAERIVADGRALLVIGHRVSSASLAAAPVYAAAGIPAITGTSTADALTAGNPWYFRTVFDNRTQGFLIAAYLEHVLDEDHVSMLGGNDDYGQSLANGIRATFERHGEITHDLTLDTQGDHLDETLAAAAAELQTDDDRGSIVLAMQTDVATKAVVALREAGITGPIVGGDALGSNTFLASFARLPREQDQIGFYTDGLMAASPLFMDSLTSESLRWFEAFRGAYGVDPTWRGATIFDAAIASADALRTAGAEGGDADRAAERERIRDSLAALNSAERAIPGLLGPIYFDKNNTTPRAAVFGVARDGQFSSAYEQLEPYSPTGGLGLEADLASGAAIDVDGQILQRQRIVFAGVNFNEIGELDTTNPSFYADFFLWFNYAGGDSAADIAFVNADDAMLTLGAPVREVKHDGTTYRLYRVTGRFKVPLEFQDFPFDKQQLLISFQNRSLPSSHLVYAVDRELLALPQERRLLSGSNAAVSINTIPSWHATGLQVYQDSIGSTALLGDPEASLGSSGIEYSLFTADVTVKRDVGAFLGKNLLPLVLLAAVTYISLFFPHTLTEARITFGVSGILTAAVLLASVTSVLPQVGYTVAIEWGFYAFILLSASCILFGLAGDWLYEQRRLSDLRRLDLASQVFYPAFVLVVVLAYVVRYGGG
jgi:ABC-type branched-subunit amino acid transport system substrate-binding protein